MNANAGRHTTIPAPAEASCRKRPQTHQVSLLLLSVAAPGARCFHARCHIHADMIIFKLSVGEDKPLLLGWNAFLILET